MATAKLTNDIPHAAPLVDGPITMDPSCPWEDELRQQGVPVQTPWVFRVGAPLLAAISVVAIAVVAAIDGSLTLPAGILIALATLPWLGWVLKGDDGPSWIFLFAATGPTTALAIGHWFASNVGPLSEHAAWLLPFSGLMLASMGICFAESRMAIGYAIVPFVAFGLPLAIATITGDEGSPAYLIVWTGGYALTALASYSVRLSYEANRALADARVALAQQERIDERRQIARDVHDVVAHTLAVTMLHITAARMAVDRGDSTEAEAALEEAERQGRASLADVRRVVRLLREDGGTATATAQPDLTDIDDLVSAWRGAGMDVAFTRSANGHRATPAAELALFRVLQESLTNAARYGENAVSIALDARENDLVLTVANLIAAHRPRPAGTGSGLTGMRERIEAAGGSFAAGARAGHWTVTASIPADDGSDA